MVNNIKTYLLITSTLCYAFIQSFIPNTYESLRTGLYLSPSIDISNTVNSIPPVLKDYSQRLRSVSDDKLRYMQLLHMAAKLPALDPAFKIEENKVPGCLSTVYVHATMDTEGNIYFKGDSDSQLTKGLVALLVEGLSGQPVEVIDKVSPDFLQYAGISGTLTPGRNNGFLNMLNLMKRKSKQLYESKNSEIFQSVPLAIQPEQVSTKQKIEEVSSKPSELKPPEHVSEPDEATPLSLEAITKKYQSVGIMCQTIAKKLSVLKPISLEIEDESHRHAGHMEMNSNQTNETHFNVKIIAKCFQGLSLVQRHQMVYTLLNTEMKTPGGIHALSIQAKTPDETVGKSL